MMHIHLDLKAFMVLHRNSVKNKKKLVLLICNCPVPNII